ncbi:MAG: hypothetical protein H6651_20865 [Ardenticatenales bacterium]|nr:hypothetical protein [Ardenticatenales bacterium]
MRRTHPIFSPIALVATAILLVILGLALYLTGGRAFSPGTLSDVAQRQLANSEFSSHAEFQDDCSQCHGPFQGVEAARCGTCHELVMDQIEGNSGFHGQIESMDCRDCHTEHQGGEFDLLADALGQFTAADHGAFFVLDGAHTPLECEACHQADRFTGLGNACQDCHQEPEVHVGEFGRECSHCHTTATWEDGIMRIHTFPLDHGIEQEVPCVACHAEQLTSYDCTSCHEHRPDLVESQHDEVDLTETPLLACASCHPAGLVEEDGS